MGAGVGVVALQGGARFTDPCGADIAAGAGVAVVTSAAKRCMLAAFLSRATICRASIIVVAVALIGQAVAIIVLAVAGFGDRGWRIACRQAAYVTTAVAWTKYRGVFRAWIGCGAGRAEFGGLGSVRAGALGGRTAATAYALIARRTFGVLDVFAGIAVRAAALARNAAEVAIAAQVDAGCPGNAKRCAVFAIGARIA